MGAGAEQFDPSEETMTVTESLPGIDAVRRALEIDVQDAQVRTTLDLTTNIALAPAQLWPLLTTADGLASWYGPVTGELEVGGRYTAPGGASGRILDVAVPHKLSLTWEYGENADPLQIHLDPEDDGTTLLRLRHVAGIPREVFDRFGPGAAAVGWEIALLGLAAATDGWRASCMEPVPAPTPLWLASSDGAAHVQAWAVRWAAEAVAAGVDEETARRGERETAAAYGA